jgi:hypothetical protein
MPCSNQGSAALDVLSKGTSGALKAEHFLRFGGSLFIPAGPTEHQLGTSLSQHNATHWLMLTARLGGLECGGRMPRPPSTSLVTMPRLAFAE